MFTAAWHTVSGHTVEANIQKTALL